MTFSLSHPKAEWAKVAREALKQPFNFGLYDMGLAALHFAGAAVTGSPWMAQMGCAWGMMGGTYFGLHAKSTLHPGPSDRLKDIPRHVRLARPQLSWKETFLEIAKHPVKTGAAELGAGVAAAGTGFVIDNPLILGVGVSLAGTGEKRMLNYFAAKRFPELVA